MAGSTRQSIPVRSKIHSWVVSTRSANWALVTRYDAPAPDRFVRHITTFLATGDGSWRRDDERHDNVLVDTTAVPAALAGHGVEARVTPSFGAEPLPDGMVAITGRRI